MSIVVREGEGADWPAILALHRSVFPGGAETELLDALDTAGDMLLSMVAERDGVIVAHAGFSRIEATGDGKPLAAAQLAVVGVLPELQGRGIGAGLIDQALAALEERGVAFVFVLGEPSFFEQFGFDAAIGRRFASPFAGDEWMGLMLGEQKLPRRGAAEHPPAFALIGD